ncbi:MAG: outer membrane beta-barrel protein, partial [Fluviibacter sp.]
QNGVVPKFHVSIPARFEYQSSYGNNNLANNPAGLMYGPGSAAWSGTLTPTMQWGKVFARGELSYVKAFNSLAGQAFGANGLNNNQTRVMIEAGLLF